ncbi:MAG: hypothetical protein HKO65_10815 [Gemmatimonadetes bacterium]|nr:hypothetical protein [Gemmatimonadota bacterium]NNM05567.1 hypothetical protein [Gemmatimonadota bacterium]
MSDSSAEEDSREFTGGSALADWARKRLAEISTDREAGSVDLEERLERLRAMYFLSVEEIEWADRAKDSLRAIREDIPVGTDHEVTFKAYQGALQVVRAKHARLPWNKVKHLNRGGEALDSLVLSEPANLEVRYLRLASYMFLPFFLSRGESVASDLETLIEELPGNPGAFSPPVYRAVVEFVLENGELDDADRDRLRGALETETPVITYTIERINSDG